MLPGSQTVLANSLALALALPRKIISHLFLSSQSLRIPFHTHPQL